MGGGVYLVVRCGPALMVVRNVLGFFSARFIYRYIFSPAPASKVGTVAEQDVYQAEWLSRRR